METQSTQTDIKKEVLANRFWLEEIINKPIDRTASDFRQQVLTEEAETVGMKKVVQTELGTLVQVTDRTQKNPADAELASIIGMVYTMIEEDRISEMYEAIKKGFPEYYHD